jgi:hypothetical protein
VFLARSFWPNLSGLHNLLLDLDPIPQRCLPSMPTATKIANVLVNATIMTVATRPKRLQMLTRSVCLLESDV